jgi:hypothetical protein
MTNTNRRFVLPVVGLKGILVAFSFAGLVATNVASLVSVGFHDVLYTGLRKVLAIGGDAIASRFMQHSPTTRLNKAHAATGELQAKNHALTKELNGINAKHGNAAKSLGKSVKQRLARGVVRNVSALPAEAVPFIGIGVAISVTALDIYDACETMKEMNSLLLLLGQGEEQSDFCGIKLPTTTEVLTKLNTDWKKSVEQIAREAAAIPSNIPKPEVRLPTTQETATSICPVVVLPYLCGNR